MVFLTLALMNKSIKFGFKRKTYILFLEKKDKYVLHTRFAFHSKSLTLKYSVKL